MKKIFLILIVSVVFCGCSKDKCADSGCINGSTCVDGTCNCTNGFTGSKCQTPPPKPTASFIMNKLSCTGRCIVNFTSTSSYGFKYDWEITNNSVSTFSRYLSGKTVEFDFEDAGTYTIKHTVSNGSGSASTTKTIQIDPDNTTDPKTQVAIKVNNSSKNKYRIEINGEYAGVVYGNGFEVFYTTPGIGKLYAKQLEGYVFYPTEVNATYSGYAGQTYIWNIP